MDIKSYDQLKEEKALKREQLQLIRMRMEINCSKIAYTMEKIKENFLWLKRIKKGIQVYRSISSLWS